MTKKSLGKRKKSESGRSSYGGEVMAGGRGVSGVVVGVLQIKKEGGLWYEIRLRNRQQKNYRDPL